MNKKIMLMKKVIDVHTIAGGFVRGRGGTTGEGFARLEVGGVEVIDEEELARVDSDGELGR